MHSISRFGQVPFSQNIKCRRVIQFELESDDKTIPPFSYYPESCQNSNWTEGEFLKFEDEFEHNCYNQTACSFHFDSDWLPQTKCSVFGAQNANWQYVMTATCVTEQVKYYKGKLISKEQIAVVVVLLDLLISAILWLSVIGSRPL